MARRLPPVLMAATSLASRGFDMISRILTALSLLGALVLPSAASGETFIDKRSPMAFEFAYADPQLAAVAKYPYFRAFPDGKDRFGKDASKALGTLKFARGESRLYKEEDAKPGMIVVMRRMVFVPLVNGDYLAILEGEFNAVRTVIKKEVIDQLFSGEMTDLIFESETSKGIRPVAYNVKAVTRFRATLRDGNLLFYGGEGASTVTHFGLRTNVYESDKVPLGSDNNTEPIYVGRWVKPTMRRDGMPETLPIIN
jgi:hypothetical protein